MFHESGTILVRTVNTPHSFHIAIQAEVFWALLVLHSAMPYIMQRACAMHSEPRLQAAGCSEDRHAKLHRRALPETWQFQLMFNFELIFEHSLLLNLWLLPRIQLWDSTCGCHPQVKE